METGVKGSDLINRVAVITGGNGGIGRASALKLAATWRGNRSIVDSPLARAHREVSLREFLAGLVTC